jgi:hypothetical protein
VTSHLVLPHPANRVKGGSGVKSLTQEFLMKKSQKSEKLYQQVSFQKLLCGAAWLRVPFAFFSFLNDTEAKLLSYLMDVHTLWDSMPKYRKCKGWYFHTEAKILSKLHISSATQARALSKLIFMGLLECKRDGPFRRRYLRLNGATIAHMIDVHSSPAEGQDREEEPEDEGMGE